MTEREPISGSSRDYGAIAAPPTVGFADFSPTELYNLSEGIADNVNTIHIGLRSLEKMMKKIGGPNDNVQLRDEIHDTQQSVNSSVSATARDIQRLGVVVRRGDKPQKLQVERLTQAFRDALAKYSSVQKQVSEKMAAHMPKQKAHIDPQALERQAIADDEESSLLANQLAQQVSEKMAAHMPKQKAHIDPQALERQAIADDEESSLLANQLAQARLVEFETSMLLEKEAYMSKIEADVLDVNQIMQELAEIVVTQSQIVDTVESHIEAASARVESGVDELAKAEEHQRSYRKKMMILFIIALILGILFVVWLVKLFN